MKTTIPFSQKQVSRLLYFADEKHIQEWIDDLLEVQETADTHRPYYLHIDHIQIFPHDGLKRYPVLFVYHRVYLERGA